MLGELDMLKNGINSMAMSLAAYHEEMQHNVDQATSGYAKRWNRWKSKTSKRIWPKNAPRKRRESNYRFLANMSHETCVLRSTA